MDSTKLIDFDKTLKVIKSCTSLEHFNSADNMIDNFKEKHGINVYSRELDRVWLSLVYELEE